MNGEGEENQCVFFFIVSSLLVQKKTYSLKDSTRVIFISCHGL